LLFEKTTFRFVTATLLAALLVNTVRAATITHGSPSVTINMEFVTVGNTRNSGEQSRLLINDPDTTYYGAVDYAYRIGKYEVTKNQWDLVSSISGDLLDNPGVWVGEQPVASISWHETAMFCNWLTSGDVTKGAYAIDNSGLVTGVDRDSAISNHGTVYVIPTENEWYKAAYYDGDENTYYNYPTGPDGVPDGIGLVGDDTFDAVFLDERNQGHPNNMDDAGELSSYGTMGQGGNLWEWTETTVGSSYVLRGGGYGSVLGDLAASSRSEDGNPAEEFPSRGFRVASIPEPGSIALLVCGLLTVMVRVRRRK
jgi:sulfatase modifying factor 1